MDIDGANMPAQADAQNLLAACFETDRARLRGVAYRMLGSLAEAEDAVQEAWLRLARTDVDEVGNLSGWLTTVVARVCLDQLRSRKARREDPAGMLAEDQRVEAAAMMSTASPDPEEEALLADTVGVALLVVLDTLAPAERLAFVLHDLFGVSFEEIAPIVDRSPAAARQLASRARRRVHGRPPVEAGQARQRAVLDAFLAASRGGDFEALLAVLDPDVVFRGDEAAARLGGHGETRGARLVAEQFLGRAQAAKPALLNGTDLVALVAPHDELLLILRVTFDEDRITEIYAVADPDSLAQMELEPLA